MSKFSIIVPIYNVEQYLPKCIESLCNQSLQDIEIILVDDGSPDNCGKICDKYAAKDPRIKVIHKKNEGVSAARNDGLLAATGEYVLFCDSDDWMELDACKILYETGIKNNADIVMADIYRIYDNSQLYNQIFSQPFVIKESSKIDHLIQLMTYYTYNPYPPKSHTNSGYGGPWNKAISRSLLLSNNIKFDISVKGVGDDLLYVISSLCNAHCVAYIQSAVYNYRILTNSTLRSYKPDILAINKAIFSSLWKILYKRSNSIDTKNPFMEPYYAHIFKRLVETTNFYYFNKKNEQNILYSIKALKKTIRSEPYKKAITELNPSMLTKYHYQQWKMAQKESAIGMFLIYKISVIAKQVKHFIRSKEH